MKVSIWIIKKDLTALTKGKHVGYWYRQPSDKMLDAIQVLVTPDEFARLEDRILDTKETYPDFARKHYNDLDKEFDEAPFGD